MRIIPMYTWAKGVRNITLGQRKFMNQPWASGALLLLCVFIAMLLANLPATKEIYHHLLETRLSINIQTPTDATGGHQLNWIFPKDMTVEKFINDILMVVFFFTVGLEIKREVLFGELSTIKKALLPVIAAAGGMLVPALIYTLFNIGTAASGGWGIPTATDIAFAVGIMSFLGNRVPVSLKIFLTALAIADDLGAILVVAIFYGESVNIAFLSLALLVLSAVFIMNKLGEKRIMFYLIPAAIVWSLFYYSGIHATMSGVVMAFMIPMDARYSQAYFFRRNKEYIRRINGYEAINAEGKTEFPNAHQRHCLRRMSKISSGSIGMSYRLEHALTPWVNFLIMPIFALANAGVEIPDVSYFNFFQYSAELGSVGMGIFFGLLLGKPLGITLASFMAIKYKIGEMPTQSDWGKLFAVACLGGIGFTMSIFIDTLSFGEQPVEITEHLRAVGKIAILAASLCAGLLGSLLIALFNQKAKKQRV